MVKDLVRKPYPNLMLVRGSGRNVGKTSFVCEVIKRFSEQEDIIAIKITPHLHHTHEQKVIITNEKYRIIEENQRIGHKDTSKMLKANATRAFLVQVKDQNVGGAFDYLVDRFTLHEKLIICESGSVLNHVSPAVSVYITNVQPETWMNPQEKADIILDEKIQFKNYIYRNFATRNKIWLSR